MLIFRFLMMFLLVPLLAFGSPLEDELANDPLGRGYSSMTDVEFLTSINTKDRTRNRTNMTGRQVKKQVNVTEYAALSDAKKQQLIELTTSEDLDLFGTDRDILLDIFGGASTTVSNLLTARVESISRGIEVGLGIVTEKDLRMHTLSRKVRQ